MTYKEEDKNPVGRPLIHTDPKEVQTLIVDYFEWIEGEEGQREEIIGNDDEGKPLREMRPFWIRRPEPPTVTGLALHLGFATKQSLYNYAEKPEFLDPIKKAITRIEKHHEIKVAQGDKCTGNIFALKNFGWKDKIETEVSGNYSIAWHEERTYEADEEANDGN